MGAVFKLDLPPSEKVTALALADHAHDDGTEARPGNASLAVKVSLSERQVKRVVHSLLDQGVIEIQREATNTLPVVYRFPLDEHGNVSPRPRGDNMSPPTIHRGDTEGQLGVTPRVTGGDTGDTQTVIEPSGEPSSIKPDETSSEKMRKLRNLDARAAVIYDAYPKKVDRQRAIRVIVAQLRKGAGDASMLDAVANYVATQVDPKYTKHAATFFADGTWQEWITGSPHALSEAQRSIKRSDDVQTALEAIEGFYRTNVSRDTSTLPDIAKTLFERLGEVRIARMDMTEVRNVLIAIAYEGSPGVS